MLRNRTFRELTPGNNGRPRFCFFFVCCGLCAMGATQLENYRRAMPFGRMTQLEGYWEKERALGTLQART